MRYPYGPAKYLLVTSFVACETRSLPDRLMVRTTVLVRSIEFSPCQQQLWKKGIYRVHCEHIVTDFCININQRYFYLVAWSSIVRLGGISRFSSGEKHLCTVSIYYITRLNWLWAGSMNGSVVLSISTICFPGSPSHYRDCSGFTI